MLENEYFQVKKTPLHQDYSLLIEIHWNYPQQVNRIFKLYLSCLMAYLPNLRLLIARGLLSANKCEL